MKTNYDKFPTVSVPAAQDACAVGWESVTEALRRATAKNIRPCLIVECYPGVRDEEVLSALMAGLKPTRVVQTRELMKCPEEIERMVAPDVTDDAVFGYWRDGNHEVDFIVQAGRRLTAIEVKSGRAPLAHPGTAAFAQAFKPQRCLLVGGDGIALEDFLLQPVQHWIVDKV